MSTQKERRATVKAPKHVHARQRTRSPSLFDKSLAFAALKQACVMLRPDLQWKNPVLFVVEIGVLLSIVLLIQGLCTGQAPVMRTAYWIALEGWLFLTVLCGNFATALAEVRGKAQTQALRRTRHDTPAFRLTETGEKACVLSTALAVGDRVVVQEGEVIPGDGEVIEGVAFVDESAITGESSPVIRAADSDCSGVTGGTLVLSDTITVQITARAGETFLDKMIALVEGAIRQRSPNEVALMLLLSALTLIFLIVVVPLWAMAGYTERYMTLYLGLRSTLKSLGTDIPTVVALLVCLIPTTIGALLAAIGIAGMNRALQANIIAKSGEAVELAGDVDVVLLDKTGTITVGNRRATRFLPVGQYSLDALAWLAAIASVADKTPEGKSIVALYESQHNGNVEALAGHVTEAQCIAFSAHTRMSGIDLCDGRQIRKGAPETIIAFVQNKQGILPGDVEAVVNSVASCGATPLLVAENGCIAGVIELEDILKPHMKARFQRLRRMGLRTVMITGDNPLTAAAIAKAVGVDDFVALATPAVKLAYIKKEQAAGKLVAMMGDGTNDAPALAQADVALAMNAGTEAAKDAANMVDLNSDPTQLITVVEIGKQLLMTRGALMTFSIANDVAKYFAIIPALFADTLPWLKVFNVMHLHSPTSAILSAVIFNALIIPSLIPVALRGVRYRALGADALLRRNLFFFGIGGILLPFMGIKIIDLLIG